MKPIQLDIPGATVRGELYDEYPDPADLDQDLLEIDLPSGVTICVGWFPECDPNGQFQVNVFQGYWTNRLRPTLYTKNPAEAAKMVKQVAGDFLARRMGSRHGRQRRWRSRGNPDDRLRGHALDSRNSRNWFRPLLFPDPG